MNFKFVYKICTKSEWQEIKKKGQLTGSKKDLEDGYIHFSGDDQIAGTLKKFYGKKYSQTLFMIFMSFGMSVIISVVVTAANTVIGDGF